MTDTDEVTWLLTTSSPATNYSNETTTGIDEDDVMFGMVLNSIVVPVLFGLITVVGLTGNGLVIYVIVTKRRMRTVTNLLLLNLAIADVCFVIVIPPFTAYMQATASWPFGDVPCRLLHYLVNVTAYVTVYTLVLIAALRYATIVHSTSTVQYRTRRNMMLAVAAIWGLMLLVNSPILASYGVVDERGYVICDIKANDEQHQKKVPLFDVFSALTTYTRPLVALGLSCQTSRP